MDRSTHSNMRPNSGNKDKQDQANKEQIIIQLEQVLMDKIRSMLREVESEQEKQAKQKQDQGKDDQTAAAVWQNIQNLASQQQFKKLANQLNQCQSLNQQVKAKMVKLYNELNQMFTNLNNDKGIAKIKLNKYWQTLINSTNNNLKTIQDAVTRLLNAGCCGKGEATRALETEHQKLEFDAIQWRALPQLDNNNVEVFVIKNAINLEEFRSFLLRSLRDYFPSVQGGTTIIEKPVEKIVYVDKPVEKIVHVDKPIEKIVYVDKPVEKKVVEYVEKIKEVPIYKDQPVQDDRIKLAHEWLYGIGRPQNITEALNIYYELAEVNQDVTAYNIIAQIFYEGKFFPKDLNKAYTYWERSAAQQNAEGLYRIGRLLMDRKIDGQTVSQGRLKSRDEELSESVVYFQQACEQGHLDALVDLGEVFEKGLFSEEQPEQMIQEPQLEQAEFYYQQGKKVRYPRAINALGLFYLNHPDYQEIVLGNNARKAIKYFEMARELGYSNSLFWLAFCYENGQGVLPNIEQAKSYYKEGALKGDPACRLQYMHYIMKDSSNSGKQEDYLFCHQYLIQIMIQNPEITEVYFYLGHLYECGFGVQKDPQNAIHYYFKGAKLNNPSCMTKLGDCYHCGFGVPQNQREALKYYRQAADLKDSEALINMGLIYEQGYEGVAVDFAKAFNSYEQAVKLQNPKADFHLGLMYEAGKYVKKDINYAIQRYQKAAQMGCQEARELLQKKQIPMLYDDTVGNGDQENDIHAANRNALMLNEVIPIISNPLIIQTGKKTNQSILQTKSQKQEMGEARMVSVLAQPNATQSNFVQSHFQRPGQQY